MESTPSFTSSDTTSLRISSPLEEGTFQASKWLQWQVLLDTHEMQALLESLPPFSIHIVSTLVEHSHGRITLGQFLEEYDAYVSSLKRGEQPDEMRCRPFFSSVFTVDSDALYAMQTGSKFLIKPIRPVIQLQLHHVFRGNVDGKYYPMVHAADSISWGIQWAYPQLFQDPKTKAYAKVDASACFPNTLFFTQLAKWVRVNTLPTPFVFEGKKVNVPIRLGKDCWSWIGKHPHLLRKGITIASRRDSSDVI